MRKSDPDENATHELSPRMMRSNPDPTEFQMSGGVIGVVVVGGAAIGILYALFKIIGWL